MGIWVVVLEAVAGDDPTTIEPGDLDSLAEELAECYPRVSGGPSFYQAEFWIEESNPGGAVLTALREWQAAVRELGMPPWDVVRAEARDAHAIEAGLIEWTPPDDDAENEEFEALAEAEADEGSDEPDTDIDTEELEDVAVLEEPVPAVTAEPVLTKRAPAKKASAKKAAAKKAAAKKALAKKTPAKKAAAKKAGARARKRR